MAQATLENGNVEAGQDPIFEPVQSRGRSQQDMGKGEYKERMLARCQELDSHNNDSQ